MSTQTEERLIAVADIGETGVTAVETSHGTLAVGLSGGTPFATSNRCRHLFGKLSSGRVAEDGCLECPLHRARFDVATGKMTRGPQGAFRPVSGAIRGTTGRIALDVYPVVERDGVLYLAAG